MEVIMSSRKKIFFTVLVSAILSGMLPAYADTLKVSIKQYTVRNTTSIKKNINCTLGKKKGRNQRSIKCSPTRKTHRFNKPQIGGFSIDACVYGAGWKTSSAMRCDSKRTKKIANEFCKSKGYKRSGGYIKVAHNGKHAILTYKKSKPSHSFWKRRKGDSVLQAIACK